MGNYLIVDKDILTVSSDNSSYNTFIRTIHFRRRNTCYGKTLSKTLSKILQINGNIISCSAFGNIIIDDIGKNNIIHYRITPELINGVIVVVYSAN